MTKLKDWSQNLSNKRYLLNESERLYIYELNSIEEIARKVNISTKTVSRWKEQFDWDHKKRMFLKSKQTFHNEMYEFARKLMTGIMADMEAGEKVDSSRMYAFCKIIPMFTKVKDYEDVMNKKDEDRPKGLTPDLVRQIEQEVLGIVPNDDNEEE